MQQTVSRSRVNDFNASCNISVIDCSKGNAMCTAYAQRMQNEQSIRVAAKAVFFKISFTSKLRINYE